MHEWALAEAVISTTLEIAEKEGLKEIREVIIKVGELQQVEHDIFSFALSELKKGKFENVKFIIETVKAKMKCRVCGQEWAFNKKALDDDSAEAVHFVPETVHAYIRCPKCGSPDFEILQGRGIWLESIKGVK